MSLIEEIKELAADQLNTENYEGTSFEYEGQTIIDPWIDSSARFALTTEGAFKAYGSSNLLHFIEDAAKELYPESPPLPDEELLLAEISGELGDSVQVCKRATYWRRRHFAEKDKTPSPCWWLEAGDLTSRAHSSPAYRSRGLLRYVMRKDI